MQLWVPKQWEEVWENINITCIVEVLEDNKSESRAWQDREDENKEIIGQIVKIWE